MAVLHPTFDDQIATGQVIKTKSWGRLYGIGYLQINHINPRFTNQIYRERPAIAVLLVLQPLLFMYSEDQIATGQVIPRVVSTTTATIFMYI